MRIGFACLWDRDPAPTWSHIPWQLRAALRRHAGSGGGVSVVDVGIAPAPATRLALTALHARRHQGRLITLWQQSRVTDAYCRGVIARRAARAGCDAVVEIQDLAPVATPYFVFQDMSFDALLHLRDTAGVPLFRAMSARTLRQRRDRQRRVYERAAGVLAMSHWLARSLVEVTGLPPDRVHVIHPGVSATGVSAAGVSASGVPAAAVPAGTAPPGRSAESAGGAPEVPGPRRRLLFVGRDFIRKGGDLVVAALAVLRREVDPAITLTVAGPAAWPLPGPVPDGVRFLGDLPLADVTRLYDSHDLFVMPSRLEPFGIVFAEAAARGLPCVGRDAFAMPEVIEPGVTGALVRGDDPAGLARVIAKTLGDDELYHRCRSRAATVAGRFSWDRAARETVAAIGTALGR